MASDRSDDDPSRLPIDRRSVMQWLGIAGATGLAGCGGGDGTDTPTSGGTQTGSTTTMTTTPTSTPPETVAFETGGTLKGSMPSNPSSFDPPYSSGVPSSSAQSFFYEALTTTDARGNIYPWIAKSYSLEATNGDVGPTSYEQYMVEIPYALDKDGNPFPDTDKQIAIKHPDNTPGQGNTGQFLTVDEVDEAVNDGTFGMKYQFNLHEGVTFHNGEELTAQNVVDSYKRYENSQVSAQVWLNFLYAEKVDQYTVNLYAQEPSAEALRNIVWDIFPSRDTETDDQGNLVIPGGNLDPRSGNNPIGTGAFQFEEFQDQNFLRVSTYDDYWMKDVGVGSKFDDFDVPSNFPNTPAVDEVKLSIIPDNAQRASALQEGEIDVARGLNAQQQTNFDGSSGFNVVATETGGYLFFQYSVKVSPWDKKKVRQAANHLIPRKTIANDIEKGWTRPAWTPLPELAYGAGTADPEALRADLKPKNELSKQKAKDLLNQVDVSFPIKSTIETNQNNTNRVQKAELIAQTMNSVTIDGQQAFDISVQTFEFGALVGRIFQPDYPTMNNILLIGLSGTFDPGSFCEATHHSRNIGQCCNAQGISFDQLDQMMDNAKFGSDVLNNQQARARAYDEIWRRIVELSANSYVDIDQTVAVTDANRVKNWSTYPFPEGIYDYALYSPVDSQLMYIPKGQQS